MGTPAAAATLLLNPSATPTSGTTATTFVLSVEYVSDPEARPATSVNVEIVGLGTPLPMSLVAGDATNGTWETSTMLPAGSWDLVFRADASGSDPDPANGPTITVIDQATPTPSPTATFTPTPPPSSTPTAAPTAAQAPTPTPTPTPTTRPTPRPTPLPPGVTPTPLATAAPGSAQPSSASPSEPPVSPSADPSDGSSIGPSPSARPAHGTATPSSAAEPSPTPGGADDGGEGWGRAGWIVLGGVTSAAGAAVLARQWLARRRAGSGAG